MTKVFKGGRLPGWAMVNSPALPYLVGSSGSVVGYLFTPRLSAGEGASNKILWYVSSPRQGQPLLADGHPAETSSPTVHFSKSADSWPGEIYPSGPLVPSPGCWRFTLSWLAGTRTAEVDLNFQ